MLVAGNKTTKMPEQLVTDTGPGNKTRPEPEKSLVPRSTKKGGTAGNELTSVRL